MSGRAIGLRRTTDALRGHRRGRLAAVLLGVLMLLSLMAEFVANDRPIVVLYDGGLYWPVFNDYTERQFGGRHPIRADFRDPHVQGLVKQKGRMIWPPVRFSYDTVNYGLKTTVPAPVSGENWLGTDDQGRDVLARLIYGLRLSLLFGIALTLLSTVIGVVAGSVQGFFGGWIDLIGQRLLEIWAGIPIIYLLIIVSSVLVPGFFTLLLVMLLFTWMAMVGVVRAETLKVRKQDYVRAAEAMGMPPMRVLFRHVVPNSLTATIAFLPLTLGGAITALTGLDFLGFGMPPEAASLGELLQQGKNNLDTPRLALIAFLVPTVLLVLIGFMGDAVRDALDVRRPGQVTAGRAGMFFQPKAEPGDQTPPLSSDDAILLRIRGLSVAFETPGRRVTALDAVDLDIERGEILALVGASGSGKSTLAGAVLDLLAPTAKRSGSVVFAGHPGPVGALAGSRIGMIFQEPSAALDPLQSVESLIAEPLEIHRGLDRRAARSRIVELLDSVGFPAAAERLDALPHQLSGGERQRLMIAAAIANDPELLIADEPTASLDADVRDQIVALLQSLNRDRGLSILFVSHDVKLVGRIADRIAVMDDGKVVEIGSTETILTKPDAAASKRILFRELPTIGVRPMVEGAPLLRVEALEVAYDVRRFWSLGARVKPVVSNVDFTVARGRTLGLVGPSGSGKTTIALAVARLIDPSGGRITFDGRPIAAFRGRDIRDYRRQVQFVFQDPFGSLSPRLTVQAIVAEGLHVHERGLDASSVAAQVAAALDEVGLPPDIAARYPHELSGGQRQRVAIARALVLKPSLLILDEPTSALDRHVQADFLRLLERLQLDRGISYILISHDWEVVSSMADHVVRLDRGSVSGAWWQGDRAMPIAVRSR